MNRRDSLILSLLIITDDVTFLVYVLKDAALNRMIALNTHLDDAHIDTDKLKFVLIRIYNHVQISRKQN